jgi:hypothetical protein
MRRLLLFLSPLLALSVVCFAEEDSPAVQAAKRERERRAKIKSVRVFTNKDIQEYLAKHKSIPAEEQADVDDSAPQTQTSETVDPYEKEEQYWRSRYRDAAARITAAKDKINQLQAEADDLTRAFYATADPHKREEINDERNKRLEDMDLAKGELDEANVALDALQEEGRKAGALPGWFRD